MTSSGKSKRIPKFIRQAAAFGGGLTGALLLLWAIAHLNIGFADGISVSLKRFCAGIGGLLLLLSATMALRPNFMSINLRLMLAACTWLYLGLEIGRYLFIGFGLAEGRDYGYEGGWGVFTQPCAVYDSVRGYRWLDQKARVAKVARGTVVFDQKIQPNNEGWIDQKDFSFTKKDSNSQRWIVFGDSYTGSEFLSETWVDVAQTSLNSRIQTDSPPELYNFGIDGGGLWNWHSTFFGELVPKYEFDGIVLAVYGNNFDRDFAIFHQTDSVAWFKYFPKKPTSQIDFEENFLPEMDHSADIISESKLNLELEKAKLQEEKRKSGRIHFTFPDLFFLMRMHDHYQLFNYKQRKQEYQEMYGSSKNHKLENYAKENFVDRYGELKWKMLTEVVEYCQANRKQIIFASVPDEQGLHFNKRGDFTMVQGEINWLANHFETKYFDGYAAFEEIPDEELNQYFLKYDMHWNKYGASHFGQKFAKWLQKK